MRGIENTGGRTPIPLLFLISDTGGGHRNAARDQLPPLQAAALGLDPEAALRPLLAYPFPLIDRGFPALLAGPALSSAVKSVPGRLLR
jgi:hypothetical protein